MWVIAMKKPLPKNEKEKEYSFFDDFDALSGVVSATECTGLMYKPAEDESEAESYNHIYTIPATANTQEERLKADGIENGSK